MSDEKREPWTTERIQAVRDLYSRMASAHDNAPGTVVDLCDELLRTRAALACDHRWDGEIVEEGQVWTVTCSRCGMAAFSHSLWTGP